MKQDQRLLWEAFVQDTDSLELERFGVELFAVRVQTTTAEALDTLLNLSTEGVVELWMEYYCDRCGELQPRRLPGAEVLPHMTFECYQCGEMFALTNPADYALKFGCNPGWLQGIMEKRATATPSAPTHVSTAPAMSGAEPGLTLGDSIAKYRGDFEDARLRNDLGAAREAVHQLRALRAARALTAAEECLRKWPKAG